MKPDYTLEVCVDSVESAITAAENGATRLELCSNLIIGGTTPSLELYREIRRHTDIDINVLIRPRFGDFHYSNYELNIMCKEIDTFANENAHGIVIGALNTDGSLDVPAMKKMIEAAKTCHVTLHRAFDVCKNPFEVLLQAKNLGVDTILTSGQAKTCLEGKALLEELMHKAPNGLNLLIGAGVTPEVIEKIMETMPARHFHMSGKKILESPMEWKNPKINMGLPGISEFEIYRTDGKQIKKTKEILAKFHHK